MDMGTEYRSIILCEDEEQVDIALASKEAKQVIDRHTSLRQTRFYRRKQVVKLAGREAENITAVSVYCSSMSCTHVLDAMLCVGRLEMKRRLRLLLLLLLFVGCCCSCYDFR